MGPCRVSIDGTMSMEEELELRYFLTYSGVNLPLKLIMPLSPESIENRNTYFAARIDDLGRLIACRKIVYGEVEFDQSFESSL